MKNSIEATKMPPMPKRVNIEEADNGYIVSANDNGKEKRMVCKTADEAMAAVKDMIGVKAEEKESEGSYKERGNEVKQNL